MTIIESNILELETTIKSLGDTWNREEILSEIPPLEFRSSENLEIGIYDFKIGGVNFYSAKVYPNKIDQSGNLWYKSCWYNWSVGVEESTPTTN